MTHTLRPTSRDRKVSAVKEEATRLHSKIIRETRGPMCENGCGNLAKDAAHIIPRGPSHTRTDLDNAFALCKSCHAHFGLWLTDWLAFIDEKIGMAEYERLERKARDGVNVKVDWYDELDRLRAIAAEVLR